METDLICIVCNDIFPDSSKLCKHHQALHSKQELSRALLHLQVLLKQCQAAFKRFNQDKLDDGNATKNKIKLFGRINSLLLSLTYQTIFLFNLPEEMNIVLQVAKNKDF